MESIVSSVMSRVKTLYSREDFARKIDEVMSQHNAKSPHKSAYIHRFTELKEMCDICEIDVDLLVPKTHDSELKKIPTKNELCKQLVIEMHNIYKNFPTSVVFMERIVRRLLDGEYESDSIRVAILKKLVKETEYHTKTIVSWVHDKYANCEIYNALSGQARHEFIVNHIDESIFDNLTQVSQELDTGKWAEFMLQKITDDRVKGFEISQDVTAKLRTFVQKLTLAMPTSASGIEIFQVMAEAMPLSDEDDANLMEIINLIEKELRKYSKNITYRKKTGAKGTMAEKYKQDKKDFKDKHTKDWKLLKLADDLSNSKFRVNGITKEQLYVFAIAFDMAVYLGGGHEIYDQSKDIEKNLFHDYYNDNLLRYILDDEYASNTTDYENEPTGEGINYKNYLEVIYLYYIYRTDLNLTPKQRLKKVKRLANKCVELASAPEVEAPASAPTDKTKHHRDRFMGTLMHMDDNINALAEYICQNYYLRNPDPKLISPRILFAAQQNTAKGIFEEIAKLSHEVDYGHAYDFKPEYIELDFGIDIDWLFNDLSRQFAADESFIKDVLEDKIFRKLMQKLDEKLQMSKKESMATSGENASKKYTRIKIINMYYGFFQKIMKNMVKDIIVDIPGLYEEFCNGNGITKGINQYLEECRYQRISEKNIYDMFVVFALILEHLRIK